MSIRKPKLMQLKDMTWEEFIEAKIFSAVDTWPYRPRGTIKKPQHKDVDPRESSSKLIEMQNQEYNELEHFIENFSNKQKSVISWIFAALIGVVGNLIVNLVFSPPVFSGDMFLILFCIIVFALLVLTYVKFLPKVSMIFKFIPSYKSFSSGYEKYIPQAQCKKSSSQIILSYNRLQEVVTDFGVLVRVAILKDSLLPLLKKSSYVKISDIRDIGKVAYFIEISTNGWKPWVDPKARDRIRSELRDFIQGMMNARQICSVFDFELEPKEWGLRGCDFVDAVSDWNFDNMRKDLIDKLLSVA